MESLIDLEDFPGRLLHQAALWDNAELLEDLLNGEELEYIDSCDSWGRSPVHAAATTEASLCLRILIQVDSLQCSLQSAVCSLQVGNAQYFADRGPDQHGLRTPGREPDSAPHRGRARTCWQCPDPGGCWGRPGGQGQSR